MSEHRITYTVTPWAARYKAQIKVDGFGVERAFFDDYRTATQWAQAKANEDIAATVGDSYNEDAAGKPWRDGGCLVLLALVGTIGVLSLMGAALP